MVVLSFLQLLGKLSTLGLTLWVGMVQYKLTVVSNPAKKD